jgi:glycosyltransferase involved in cell wall biosynthesis
VTVHIVHRMVDPEAPSGGDTYQRRLCDGLVEAGWTVAERAVPGAWPRPAAADREALAGALAAIPGSGVALLDGLVAGAAPEVVAAEAGRLRLVVLVHLPLGEQTWLPPAEAAELDARERRTLQAATAVVATSAWAGRRLVAHHRLAADRVRVATPGVAAAPLAPGTEAGSRLLCVAAVTPVKGQDRLVKALARIADLPWTCDCVGGWEPGYVDRVRELVHSHRLADRIRLPGSRTGAELAATYAAADLLVLASQVETYGMVVTEALARGLPVVATDVGGVREALGEAPGGARPGLLVPPADPAALAGALRRWLEQADLRRRLRAAARARRGTLAGWDATVRAVAKVLEELA